MGLFSKLFKTYSEKQIARITPTVDRIEALAEEFEAKSDKELREYTDILKSRLADGESLDDILPEAFALVREADTRVLGKRPYRVQLMGGILLHQGRIAEMKTGEGKTLVATLPAYLNALAGEGVHIVTVNGYLAKRDSEEMGRVYSFLGLSTGLIIHGQTGEEKRAAYAADITYGTNSEFGFDYLRDNMSVQKSELVQRGHAFAIVDEVDSILIDEARTPLIISGRASESTDLYKKANELVRRMKRLVLAETDAKEDLDTYSEDFVVDEKARTAVLTKNGIDKTEKFFGIENLSDPENSEIYHHVNTAIRAHGTMRRDIDYIVRDGNVLIVDHFTGRVMPGRRYSEGLHQAIEAKEGVDIKRETVTVATITYQNFFRMYKKLSGMTGTALTEEDEFKEIYALDVVEVPTNKPMIRVDHLDAVFVKEEVKYRAIIEQIKECHEKGQPVLVGTVSIEKSEELSARLSRVGIKHTVLNAKYHEREAEIVAQAGKLGAVTISTNMAGRGTDIMLGGNPEFLARRELMRLDYTEEEIQAAQDTTPTSDEKILAVREVFRTLTEKYKEELREEADKVREAGGLFILGTERHESRRIDNQLRGRSGRQGDPGESRFFISFEDDLLRLFARDRLDMITKSRAFSGDDIRMDSRLVSSVIENAQQRMEAANFQRRKNVLTYDDVMNQQRKVIYAQRMEILLEDTIQPTIRDMISSSVEAACETFLASPDPHEWELEELRTYYRGVLTDSHDFKYTEEELSGLTREALTEELKARALEIYESKDEIFAAIPELPAGIMREYEKATLLRNVDRLWMDHLEAMEDLKSYVGLNSYAQRDPVAMYKMQGADMFDEMIQEIRAETVRKVLAVMPRPSVRLSERVRVAEKLTAGFAGAKATAQTAEARTPVRATNSVGPNDPCPCGSGKKYKKCCNSPEKRIGAKEN
ncbi:MAG: preprotein translocase subunit SecA [Clostridia bacterium]|nr:preprotein translocase subunit SecA [Clostridia bacterium]